MKRFLHRLMLLALTIALPLYGSAAVVVAPGCDMQMQPVVADGGHFVQGDHSVQGDHAGHAMHDCCSKHMSIQNHKAGDSHDHKSQTDMPCKSGEHCQSGIFFIAADTLLTVSPRFEQTFAVTSAHFIAAPPHSVWRPPLLA